LLAILMSDEEAPPKQRHTSNGSPAEHEPIRMVVNRIVPRSRRVFQRPWPFGLDSDLHSGQISPPA
jgi:hypothetical protein